MNKEEWEDFVDILSNRIGLNNFGEVPNMGEFENHPDMIWLKIRGWNFIKEKLEQQKAEFLNQPANQHDQEVRKQQKKEIIERIEQLKWEDRLTEQQKLDKLINELK